MIANGTTTVEIKTGYGLTPEHELRCLDVIARLGTELPWNVEGDVSRRSRRSRRA